MQELNVKYLPEDMEKFFDTRNKERTQEMLSDLKPMINQKHIYAIPREFHGVTFSVEIEKQAIKLTVNGGEFMLTPDGAKDLGNALLKLSAILRQEKPKRRRH